MKKLLTTLISCMVLSSSLIANEERQIISKSELKWEHLNPKRGAKGPQATTL